MGKQPFYLCWAHGKDSSPWGSKSLALRDTARSMGFEMDAFDFQGEMNPDVRVEMFVAHLKGIDAPVALVGSSMGGYVSTVASNEVDVAGLLLLAPAFYIPGYHWIDFPWLKTPVTIVHGWRDEIVPVENIFRFARIHRCTLHVCDAEHRLHECMDDVHCLFKEFLHTVELQVTS